MLWRNLLADAGYSSGENYAFLEKENIISYIPKHGTYKGGPEGFISCKEENYWLCPQGVKVTFRKQRMVKNSLQNHYLTRRSDCKNCPIKQKCIGKGFEKKIGITVYKDHYERNNKRVRSKYGRRMKGKRQSTVEPVFGTLTQFMGLRKINTIGIRQANNSFLVTGGSLMQAFDRLEVAEFSAKSLVIGAPLGKNVPINDAQVEDLRKKFLG